jgi:hypothetical protein
MDTNEMRGNKKVRLGVIIVLLVIAIALYFYI